MQVSIGIPEIMAATVGAFVLLYKVWRVLKTDKDGDSHISVEQKLRDDLMQMVKDLTARCDEFARERNEVLIDAAEARAECRQTGLENAILRKRLGIDDSGFVGEDDM